MPAKNSNKRTILNEATTASSSIEIDPVLLEDWLGLTPWERIQANDDLINFGDSLPAAMKNTVKLSGNHAAKVDS